jgi:hypothetical protein
LPIDRQKNLGQIDLFADLDLSATDLLEKKNDIISLTLEKAEIFTGRKSGFHAKTLSHKNDCFLLRINVSRRVKLETEDFQVTDAENWPSFFVLIWNHPDQQYLVVQENSKAVQHTSSFVAAIKDTVNEATDKYNLKIEVEPVFEQEEFWKILEAYPDRISKVSFELVTPNMSNISGSLSDELKGTSKDINSTQSKIEFEADKHSSLKIDKGNKTIADLVEYASEGGGTASISVKGLRRISTGAKAQKTFEIDEVNITGQSAEEICKMLKELLGQNEAD